MLYLLADVLFKYFSLYALFAITAANDKQPMDCDDQLAGIKFEMGKYPGELPGVGGNVWSKLFGRISVGQMSGGTVCRNVRGQCPPGELSGECPKEVSMEMFGGIFMGKCPGDVGTVRKKKCSVLRGQMFLEENVCGKCAGGEKYPAANCPVGKICEGNCLREVREK